MMFVVEFSSMRLLEHADAVQYQNHIAKWLGIREAENSYLFSLFPQILADAKTKAYPKARLFTLEDRGNILAAGVLFVNGCILITWASDDMLTVMTKGLYDLK